MFSSDFLTLRPRAFGLDLSDLSFKIVQLSRRGRFFHLDCAATFPLPPKIIEKGEIKEEKRLAEFIQKGIASLKEFRTNHVVCSLPEEQAFLQIIQMPRMEREELESAILFEAENYIPFPVKDMYLDFELLPVSGGSSVSHMDVLVAAVSKRLADSYVVCLKTAGLHPIAFEIESFAAARALVKGGKTSLPVCILDIGATRTGFGIFSGSSLKFTASIPISSGTFSEAIAKRMKVEFLRAEELKKEYGIAERRKKEGSEVFLAIIPVLSELVEQVKKYIEFYRTHFPHEHTISQQNVERMFLCGGGAKLRGIASYLSSELKIPVEIGNPWVNILPDPVTEIPKISFEESLAYATSLGLALRGMRDGH